VSFNEAMEEAAGMFRSRCVAALLALAALMGLAACGGGEGPGPTARHTAANGTVFADADVTFATSMIQHHAQSLALIDLLVDRDVDDDLSALSDVIRERQGGEIERLAGWLDDWDQAVPETVRDHANAHGGGDGSADLGEDLPGAISTDQLQALESATGDEFERRWLELMVEHHDGALDLTDSETADGAYPPAVRLARAIASDSNSETESMTDLLER
jgi:uncharacterized protein (DUF305 family)